MTKYEEIEQEAQRIVTKTEFFNDVMAIIKNRINTLQELISFTDDVHRRNKYISALEEITRTKDALYSCSDSEMLSELSKDMFN